LENNLVTTPNIASYIRLLVNSTVYSEDPLRHCKDFFKILRYTKDII